MKIHALMEKALLEAPHEDESSEGAEFFLWLERCFGNYQELDCELMMRLDDSWWNKQNVWGNRRRSSNVSLLRAKSRFGDYKPRWLDMLYMYHNNLVHGVTSREVDLTCLTNQQVTELA